MATVERLGGDESERTGPPAAPVGDFAVDTAVRPDPTSAGRYLGEISGAWKVIFAFGGVSMAVGLRAAEVAVDRPDLSLLSAHATFCSPVRCAPVQIDTRVLRNGRSAAQATADLRNAGDEGSALHVSATFGQRHDSPIDFVEPTFPDVPPPEACAPPPEREPDDPFPEVNFFEQTDWRPASLAPWDRDQWVPGQPAEFSSWTRLLREPRRGDGTVDPIALCVPGDMIGSAVIARYGPSGPDRPPFFVLTLEIGLQVLRPWRTAWILQHVRAPWAADGYGVSQVELWSEEREMVALATQRARLRIFDPSDDFLPPG